MLNFVNAVASRGVETQWVADVKVGAVSINAAHRFLQ
jgi:hypothetical protein